MRLSIDDELVASLLLCCVFDLTEVIRRQPRNASVYYNRGVCYLKLRDKVKAAADFSKAKKLGYVPGLNGPL